MLIRRRTYGEIEEISGSSIGNYLITISHVPENPNRGEADAVRDISVIGTKESVRDYIEYLAKEFDRKNWVWDRNCYDSESVRGRIVHIDYERVENIKSIDAIILPVLKIKIS